MSQQLNPQMREVIGRALEELVDRFGTESELSKHLGISQPGINRAIRQRRGGPALQLALQNLLKLTEEQLVEKYGRSAAEPSLKLEPSEPVRQVVNGKNWLPETLVQLEALWRTTRTISKEDLTTAGLQFDTINRMFRSKYQLAG